MDIFHKKELKTSRGFTYTYYTSEGDRSLPTLLFQHGWPDHAAMWKDIAGPLRSTKHPIIIPDMLGYDGTSKPTDPSAYKWDAMTSDLIEIANAEQADRIISVGHDWGAACASRMYNYHPDRVVGVILLNVGYTSPSRQPFDLDAVNAFGKQSFGYAMFNYWHLFTADDGPDVLRDNVERLYHVMHGTGTTMQRYFTGDNALREYLTARDVEDVPLRPYARDEAFKQAFLARMRRDGFAGSQCWYKATTLNKQYECDKLLPASADKVDVPLLFIGCKDDLVCRPETMYPAIQQGLLPHLEQTEMVDAAHWVPYEQPGEVVRRIEPWLKKNFATTSVL